MVALTIVMLVSHDTTAKGGGPHVSLFLIYALPFEISSHEVGDPSMEKGINYMISIIDIIFPMFEIWEIAFVRSKIDFHCCQFVACFDSLKNPEVFDSRK